MFNLEIAPLTPTFPLWAMILIAVTGPILGAGGLSSIMKIIADRKSGVESHEVDEDDAIVRRWEALSKAQVESLLVPLQSRLAEVESKVQSLEEELSASRKKYWIAIPYIRTLRDFWHRHWVEDVPELPNIPAAITDDVYER